MYASDQRGSLPPADFTGPIFTTTGEQTRWYHRVQYMIKPQGDRLNPSLTDPNRFTIAAFLCPESFSQRLGIPDEAGANYGINVEFRRTTAPFNYRVTQIRRSAEVILVGDRWGLQATGNRDTNWYIDTVQRSVPAERRNVGDHQRLCDP